MAVLFNLKIAIPPGMLFADKKQLRGVLQKAGGEVAARARALIRAKGAKGKKRQSTPGEPPVSRTGVLASSIKVRVSRNGERVSIIDQAQSKGDAFYALFLEYGAKGGGGDVRGNTHLARTGSGVRRMNKAAINRTRVLLPHPFLTRALEDVAGAGLGKRIAEALVDGIAFKRAPRGKLP
jgi:bacteriophage HK97-gp10 putative tail-component